MEERRKFVRIERPVIVKYTTLDEVCSEDQIVSSDISEAGVRFTVYERLAKGTMLNIELHLPFDSMPVLAEGSVVWINKVKEEPIKVFEVGVVFLEIGEWDLKRFKGYINNEIKKRDLTLA